MKEELRRTPISLEFEAELWDDRAWAVPIDDMELSYAQGLVAYAVKQAALFRRLAARAREVEKAPKLARGKKRQRAPVVDPLATGMIIDDVRADSGGEDSEEEGEEEEKEEHGFVDSDEELVMGGEVDEE